METFSALLALCAGNWTVTGEFPVQRPATRSFDVFFDLHLNKRSKQWWGWWCETPSRPLWSPCNVFAYQDDTIRHKIVKMGNKIIFCVCVKKLYQNTSLTKQSTARVTINCCPTTRTPRLSLKYVKINLHNNIWIFLGETDIFSY